VTKQADRRELCPIAGCFSQGQFVAFSGGRLTVKSKQSNRFLFSAKFIPGGTMNPPDFSHSQFTEGVSEKKGKGLSSDMQVIRCSLRTEEMEAVKVLIKRPVVLAIKQICLANILVIFNCPVDR